ncbi:MAG: hypothetical protein WC382_11995 [Methanoregulaceae archaeon]
MGKNSNILILVVAACACLAGMASADSAITFEPDTLSLAQGSFAQVTVWLDQAPEGLAGYNMELSLRDPGVAEITSAAYPAWGKLTKEPLVPGQSVILSAVDIERMVQNDSVRVELATITLQGISAGTTAVGISGTQFDADGGAALTPTAGSLAVTVPGTGAPGTTAAADTMTVVLALMVLALALVGYQRYRNQ